MKGNDTEGNMSKISLQACISIFILLAGCVPVPLPFPESPPYEGKLEFLKEGSTTRKTVLFELGEPFFTLRENRFFGYSATRFDGGIGFVGYYAVLGFSWYEAYLLGIEFDEENIVTSFELGSSGVFRVNTPPAVPGEYWTVCLSKVCMRCNRLYRHCRQWEKG